MCDTLRSPQMQLRTSAAVKSEKLSRPLEVSVMVGPSGNDSARYSAFLS